MRRDYDLVIFDCDGTLVDSEPLTNRLIAEMINELGISINTEICLELFAGKTIGHITTFIEEQEVHIDNDVFEISYRERCFALFNEELNAIPGVKDLLSRLKVPFCIASNAPKKKMEITLPATGLAQYFSEDRIFSAYDVQEWKPEPALFLHAASKMNVHPSRCLVIEDTWSGAMGAVNADIDVLAYNPHGNSELYIDGVPNFGNMKDIQNYLL